MLTVSNEFKQAMKEPVKELEAYLTGSIDIRSEDDLISFKISTESGLCKTAMRKLEAKYTGEHNLLGEWVNAGFGVRVEDNTFEYLDYGSFLITEITTAKDTGITTVTGYDKMLNSMKSYQALEVEYPINLIDYTRELCKSCNLELGNDLFGNNLFNYSTSGFRPNMSTYCESYSKIENGYRGKGNDATGTGSNSYNNGMIAINGTWDTSIQAADTLTLVADINIISNPYNVTEAQCSLGSGTQIIDIIDITGDKILIKNTHGALNLTSSQIFELRLCSCEIELTNIMLLKGDYTLDTIPSYSDYNKMNDWLIAQELWENIEGITYRDIFTQIAQVTGTSCIVSNDNKVYFKPLTETNEQLTYDNMFKLKLEAKYGEINSVVLARTPQEDNIYMKDQSSIEENGLTEFRIENNEIIDKARDLAMTPIFNALHGITYYPFESTTEGLGWFEIGDSISIVNNTGDVFNTSLFNISVSIDGALKEVLKTSAETKTQTQYQFATTIAKRVKNTEIITNKQEQYIQSLVSDMYDENGVINEKFTQVYQDLTNIINSVQNSGGSNLIKNSVMFAYDNENVPTNWDISDTSGLIIGTNTESLNAGGLSGHGFSLLNSKASQRITVNMDSVYTFSSRIKKLATGSCYVKIYNDDEEHIIELATGEDANYEEYEIANLRPTNNYYIIEFYGSSDSEATFTDNMFSIGEYKTQWTQANGEIMNTQVIVNLNGLLVKSSIYLGDYTVMSPLEFAGYSNINGVTTRVFSLNKDITEVEKLWARKEIKMMPIKVVPILEGAKTGWAFVKSEV